MVRFSQKDPSSVLCGGGAADMNGLECECSASKSKWSRMALLAPEWLAYIRVSMSAVKARKDGLNGGIEIRDKKYRETRTIADEGVGFSCAPEPRLLDGRVLIRDLFGWVILAGLWQVKVRR